MFLILSPDWICHELLVNNYSSSELCEELANRLQIVTDLSIFTDSPLFLLVFTSREKMSAIVSCYKHIQTFANKSFYIYGLLSEHSVHTSVRYWLTSSLHAVRRSVHTLRRTRLASCSRTAVWTRIRQQKINKKETRNKNKNTFNRGSSQIFQ